MSVIIQYPNYCSIYSYTANGVELRKNCARDVCFGTSLRSLNRGLNTANYTIVLIKNTSYLERNYNNYCWMTKHQVENYLRRISTIKAFKYKVKDSTFADRPCYKIYLSISGTNKEITFVLQCIKRTYEWPFNFYLMHAYKMQKLPAFKFDSILNLYNVVWSAYSRAEYNGHSFSGNSYFVKYKTLREKLPNIKACTELFNDSEWEINRPKTVQFSKQETPYNTGIENRPCDVSEWNNDDYFRIVLPRYIDNYNILKYHA